MLLSYMASEFWYDAPPSSLSSSTTCTSASTHEVNLPPSRLSWILQKIVLLEKAKNVDWRYMHESNDRANNNKTSTNNIGFIIPRIEIWDNTNLHDTDDLVTRFETLCTNTSNDIVNNHGQFVPLALSGIHLCKLLSPSLINLANALESLSLLGSMLHAPHGDH
jgi:hypothetical protein